MGNRGEWRKRYAALASAGSDRIKWAMKNASPGALGDLHASAPRTQNDTQAENRNTTPKREFVATH